MDIVLFIIGIILFILLIVLHELGHAIASRRNGVVVEEFGVGFPPRAWSKKLKNGVLFSVNWLPIGGFVKLQGEHDAASKKGDYGAANLWVKTKILLAGVVINILTAVVLFTVLAAVGLPQILENQFTVPSDTKTSSQKVVIAEITKDSAADKAGLKTGDVIKKVDDVNISGALVLVKTTKEKAGTTVTINFERNGASKQVTAKLAPPSQQGGYLGVGPGEQVIRQSTWSAPIVGVGVTVQFAGATFQGLGSAIGNLGSGLYNKVFGNDQAKKQGDQAIGAAGQSVAGPIGIVKILMQTAQSMGLVGVLFIIAIISMTLGVMNVLPIPALDGGRLFVTLLFRWFKKPLTKEREEKIQAFGFLSLMALFVLITFLDVTKLVNGH